jgi:predicted DNA-binding ribbon-helix-helix protein
MERVFWQALEQFAAVDSRSVASIVEEIDHRRTAPLSRSVRVFVLQRTQGE